jgi:hypothetical protein
VRLLLCSLHASDILTRDLVNVSPLTTRWKKKPSFHEHSTRLLLLLTIIHTIPVVWLTPVAGGTAPIGALLAFGIAWGLAWMLAKLVMRLPKFARLSLLTIAVFVPLATLYYPILVM